MSTFHSISCLIPYHLKSNDKNKALMWIISVDIFHLLVLQPRKLIADGRFNKIKFKWTFWTLYVPVTFHLCLYSHSQHFVILFCTKNLYITSQEKPYFIISLLNRAFDQSEELISWHLSKILPTFAWFLYQFSTL